MKIKTDEVQIVDKEGWFSNTKNIVYYGDPNPRNHDLHVLCKNVDEVIFHGDLFAKKKWDSIVITPMVERNMLVEYNEKSNRVIISTEVSKCK